MHARVVVSEHSSDSSRSSTPPKSLSEQESESPNEGNCTDPRSLTPKKTSHIGHRCQIAMVGHVRWAP